MIKLGMLTFLITFFLAPSGFAQNCFPSGITFRNQSQIDNFSKNYPGCTIIDGNVSIENVSNLLGLSQIKYIAGSLVLRSSIKDLNGLNNLTSVGGDLTITNNFLITDFNGLNGLNSIGGNLLIKTNNILDNVNGLESLKSIGGDLIINDNYVLNNIDGIKNVATIGKNLVISANNKLLNINGLLSVTELNNDLVIESNPILTSLGGLNNLKTVKRDLKVRLNNSLKDFQGLNGLSSTGRFFDIELNNNLSTLAGLENLNTIYRLFVFDNDNLINFEGLNNLKFINENLTLFGNDKLVSLNGLENVTSIEGMLQIKACNELVNLTGLAALSKVGIAFEISNNFGMTSLQGVNSLVSTGNISISGCRYLENLMGLESVKNMNNRSFAVSYCDKLTSLKGVENIDHKTIGFVTIELNPLLSTCAIESICNYLANIEKSVTIRSNKLGCNSRDQVTAMCKSILSVDKNDPLLSTTLYPNPTVDKVNIDTKSECKMYIYNNIGQQLKELNLVVGYNEVNLDFLPSGTYFLRTENGSTLKILKK